MSVILARLSLVFAIIALPLQNVTAKPPKCTDNMAYAGEPSISVSIEIPTAEEKTESVEKTKSSAVLTTAFADMMTKSKASSMTIALADANGPIWSKTGGLQNLEKLHYWASVGKAYTAVIIMQLVETKQLSLDDRLSKWVKDVPNGDLITVKMLLNHTSGLYSTNEDQAATKNGTKSLTLKDQIRILKKHGPLFCPGQYWRYSNSGYYF